MMKVDTEKCTGCGLCARDCFPGDIKMSSGKAKIRNITCFKCGHCIAVCPVNAITTDEYDMHEVKEYSKEKFDIDPENLLNFIKFRRSVRQFKSIDVAKDKLSYNRSRKVHPDRRKSSGRFIYSRKRKSGGNKGAHI